jgi:hypothetical protein
MDYDDAPVVRSQCKKQIRLTVRQVPRFLITSAFVDPVEGAIAMHGLRRDL